MLSDSLSCLARDVPRLPATGNEVTSLVEQAEVEGLLLLAAALDVGIIDALAGANGLDAQEVARLTSADPRAVRVTLDALVAIGVVQSGGDRAHPRFWLTVLGRRRLVDPGPDYERYSILHKRNRMRGWLELPEVVRSGRPVERERSSRDLVVAARAMAERDPAVLDEVIDACLSYAGAGVKDMLDVGGAVGHVAARFAARGVVATLCDRPPVLEEAGRFLGSSTTVRLVPCDFTVALPPGPFDLIYLGNVCHIYGPGENRALMERVYAELSPRGTIAIRDFVYERSTRAPMFAVNMLQATAEGGVWREEQYRDWLASAGFEDLQLIDLQLSPSQLVLGKHP